MLIRYFLPLLFLAAKAAALPGQAALFLRPKPLLSPRKERWLRKMEVEPTAYNWQHPQTRSLFLNIRRNGIASNIMFGLTAGYAGYSTYKLMTAERTPRYPNQANNIPVVFPVIPERPVRVLLLSLALPMA